MKTIYCITALGRGGARSILLNSTGQIPAVCDDQPLTRPD
jgi:hypothetical protein